MTDELVGVNADVPVESFVAATPKEYSNKTLDEKIDDILTSKESDNVKKKMFLRLIAADRLEFAKIWLRVEDKHGPFFVERVKKSAVVG